MDSETSKETTTTRRNPEEDCTTTHTGRESLRNFIFSIHLEYSSRPMVFPTNKTLTAVYGQPLTLSTEFCANPAYTKAFWIVKDRIYIPGEADNNILAYTITNATSPNCHQAVLYMNRVTSEDVGEYILIVRSANGLSEGVFNVNMTYASGYNIQSASSSIATPTPKKFTNCVNYVFVTILIRITRCY